MTEPTVEQLAELEVLMESLDEIVAEMMTQDNAATAHPIFLVQQRRRLLGIDLDYDPPTTWVHEADHGCFYSEEVVISMLREDDRDNRLGNLADHEIDPADHGYEKMGYHDNWEYVCAHFTRKSAERYIEVNRHNLTEPRIFVHSQHRCREWQVIVRALPRLLAEVRRLQSDLDDEVRDRRMLEGQS